MKQVILIIAIVFCTVRTNAQLKLGLMSATAPNDIEAGDFIVNTIDDSIRYAVTSANATWHVGTFAKLQTGPLFVKGAVLVGFGYFYYDKDDLLVPSSSIENIREFEYQLDIPLDIGFQYRSFFATGGLIWSGHFIPEEQNILLSNTFSKLFQEERYGYKFGIGFDFDWQATLEINYSFYNDVSDRIVLDDNASYNYNINRHTVMVNFSWNFIRAGWE